MQELESSKKSATASRVPLPIAYSAKTAAPPHAGAGSSTGAARGARPSAALATGKEKEDIAKLQSELTKAKEALAKTNAELQSKEGMVTKEEYNKRETRYKTLASQVNRLGWSSAEFVKLDEQGQKKKLGPKEFTDALLVKLEAGKVSHLLQCCPYFTTSPVCVRFCNHPASKGQQLLVDYVTRSLNMQC